MIDYLVHSNIYACTFRNYFHSPTHLSLVVSLIKLLSSEVKEVRKERDPISSSRALIIEGNLATEEELDVSLHVQENEFYHVYGSFLHSNTTRFFVITLIFPLSLSLSLSENSWWSRCPHSGGCSVCTVWCWATAWRTLHKHLLLHSQWAS